MSQSTRTAIEFQVSVAAKGEYNILDIIHRYGSFYQVTWTKPGFTTPFCQYINA